MPRFVQVAASLLVSPRQNLHNLDNCCSRWEIQAWINLLFHRPHSHCEATLERFTGICLAYLPSFRNIWFLTADKVTFFLEKNWFFSKKAVCAMVFFAVKLLRKKDLYATEEAAKALLCSFFNKFFKNTEKSVTESTPAGL